MAAVATLIGGLVGFFGFWVAWLGFDQSFWTSLGVYFSVGSVTMLALLFRAFTKGVFDGSIALDPGRTLAARADT